LQQSEDISFFFGAGASAAYGIPTMSEMTNSFKDELDKNGSPREKELYEDIVLRLDEELEEGDNTAVDIERIFT
jgi:NAD-dependent SIR2 family protein deacetylase